MSHSTFRKLIRRINLYPPYLGMGIRVLGVNDTNNRYEVRLKSTWYNRNLFGTHFGGSLYAMADPFFVFILMQYLGRDYVVWDQGASIRFEKPARGDITGIFEVPLDRLEEIRQQVDTEGRKRFHFQATLNDREGTAVATVEKEVYVRRKEAKAAA